MSSCVSCRRRVLRAQLQRGKAFRFAGGLLCVTCAPRRLDCLTLEQREFLRKLAPSAISAARSASVASRV